MTSILAPLAAAYKFASITRSACYRHRLLRARNLNQPVISVGNLTVGGTGKTPLVAMLATLMLKRGLTPAILTRGYHRRRGKRLIALAPSPSRFPNPRETGDEPAMLARLLPEVPIVIGASRYEAGLYAEETFRVGVHLLDDGFQHLQLARILDVVALDVTQDFSDCAILPAGRLREPVSALGRAQVIVVTRVELGDGSRLEQAVRRINSSAHVLRSRIKLAALSHIVSGERVPAAALDRTPIYAFCAIGNPRAFFRDLERWGFRVNGRRAFPDHHVYTRADTALIAREAAALNASALITTEKDLMNLPAAWKPPLDAYACVIEMEMDNAATFEAAVLAHLPVSG